MSAPSGGTATLAANASGSVAVCGNIPTGESDELDAAAWIFHKDLLGEAWVSHYALLPDLENEFTEVVADCTWVDKERVLRSLPEKAAWPMPSCVHGERSARSPERPRNVGVSAGVDEL